MHTSEIQRSKILKEVTQCQLGIAMFLEQSEPELRCTVTKICSSAKGALIQKGVLIDLSHGLVRSDTNRFLLEPAHEYPLQRLKKVLDDLFENGLQDYYYYRSEQDGQTFLDGNAYEVYAVHPTKGYHCAQFSNPPTPDTADLFAGIPSTRLKLAAFLWQLTNW